VSTDGQLNRSEFSKSLGIMGTTNSLLSNFIFDVRPARGHTPAPAPKLTRRGRAPERCRRSTRTATMN
jgi:hypothetical protein